MHRANHKKYWLLIFSIRIKGALLPKAQAYNAKMMRVSQQQIKLKNLKDWFQVAKKLKGSLKHQIIMSLDPLQAYGESKHEAKKIEKAKCEALGIPWNPTRVEKIYSIKTYDLYKDKCIKFGEWAKENHNVGNNINNLNKDLARKYLEYREQAGDGPYSLRTHGAAMAKLFRCSSTDFGFKYPKRDRNEITRSRGVKMHDSEFSTTKNKDIINFGRGTGLRRSELSLLKPEQIKINDNGRVVIEINKHKYGCQSKGGRSRIVEVLKDYQSHIISMRDKALEEHRDTVFDKVLNRMDEHALRREYAGLKYKEIEKIPLESLKLKYEAIIILETGLIELLIGVS